MSDLACWRHNADQVVVRIRGNEHLMDEAEACELAFHIDKVVQYGEKESLGEDYKDLRHKPKPTFSTLALFKAALGLDKPKGNFRR